MWWEYPVHVQVHYFSRAWPHCSWRCQMHLSQSDMVLTCNCRRQTNQRTEPSTHGSSPWDTARCTVPTMTRMTAPSMRVLWVTAVLSSSLDVCLCACVSSVFFSNNDKDDCTKHVIPKHMYTLDPASQNESMWATAVFSSYVCWSGKGLGISRLIECQTWSKGCEFESSQGRWRNFLLQS